MATAFYPQGMRQNSVPQGGYKTWKGTGYQSNPVGTTAGTLRPLTNMDPANKSNAQQVSYFPPGSNSKRFGLPRPIKHFRKGRSLGTFANYNQKVISSKGSSLVSQMMWLPGAFSLSQNPLTEIDNISQLTKDCSQCYGIGVVSDIYPNKTYLTENPEPKTQTPSFCCNAEQKARRRVLPASTIIKKNYYTDLQQFRQSRCQTYEQRIFNFQKGPQNLNPNAKPGGPLSLPNTYFANCQPDLEVYPSNYEPYDPENPNPINITSSIGCKIVYYKPNNFQYAQQGAVSSSTRTFKKNVDTINTNLYSLNENRALDLKNKYQPTTCRAQDYHISTRDDSRICGSNKVTPGSIPSKLKLKFIQKI